MNISPRQLRIFLALSQTLSFSRTAEQFFVTQPSLSKSVKDLETELGLLLFERSTRRVHLTPAGIRLIPLAQRTVGEFDSGLRTMHERVVRETNQLSISALPSLASALLPKVCLELEKTHPGAEVTVYDGAADAAVERLLAYTVDFAVATASPGHSELAYEEVLRDRFVVMTASSQRRKVRSEMTLDELLTLPLISMTDASTAMKLTSAAYLQRGVQFQPKYQFDQIGTIASFVGQGLGMAVLPYLGVAPLISLRGMVLSTIIDGPVRSIGILRRKASPPSAIAEQAMTGVRAVSGQLLSDSRGWVLPASGG